MECRFRDREKKIEDTESKFETECDPPSGKKMKPSEHAEYDALVDQLADRLKMARHPDSSVTIKAARLLIENILSSSNVDQRQQLSADCSDPSQETLDRTKHLAHHSSATPKAVVGDGGGGGDVDSKRANPRIQQAKFKLDDVSLPSSLVKSWTSSELSSPSLMTAPTKENNNDGSRDEDKQIRGEKLMSKGEKDELKGVLERASKSLKLLYLNDQKQLQLEVNEIISSIQSITANPKTDSSLLALSSGRR